MRSRGSGADGWWGSRRFRGRWPKTFKIFQTVGDNAWVYFSFPYHEKIAMLAGVPLALAPWRAWSPEVVGSTPPPYRNQKQWYLQCFVHCRPWNPGKMHNFEVFWLPQSLPSYLGCLGRLQIQHEEKRFMVGVSSMTATLASIWGAFFRSCSFNYISMPCPC